MRLQRGSLQKENTARSRSEAPDGEYDPTLIEYAFSAMLECSRCKEKVSCCGKGGFEPGYVLDADGQEVMDWIANYDPEYFSRPMIMIEIPGECPDAVKQKLLASFKLVFCDAAAAANQVRQAVEEILSCAGIPPRK